MKKLHQYTALLLLLVLSLAIVPPETFHHHDTASIVCHDNSDHIEETNVECELCKFVLPVFDSKDSKYFGKLSSLSFHYKQSFLVEVALNDYTIPFYRGPPEIV